MTFGFMVLINCELFRVRATRCPWALRSSDNKLLFHQVPGCVVRIQSHKRNARKGLYEMVDNDVSKKGGVLYNNENNMMWTGRGCLSWRV